MKTRTRRRLTAALLTAVVLCALCAPAMGENISDAWAQQLFSSVRAVSGQIVIVRGDQPVYAYTYGHRDPKRNKPADLNTKYVVASVTKMVSAVGLMRLYDQGWFALDDALGDHLGYPVINTQFKNEKVTIRQLLSHTTGLVQGNTYKGNWAVLSATNSSYYFAPNTPPGTAYEYSNRNGGLIGSLMEAITGLSINSYMRQNLFEPLGIDAAYSPALLKDQSNLAYQINGDGSPMASDETLIKRGKDYDDTCNPAAHQGITVGKLVISAPDLARIGVMLCGKGVWMDETILQPETVELMMADQESIPGSSVKTHGAYGLCLERVTDSRGNTWYGHQGRVNGLSADVFFQPEAGMTIVVICSGWRFQSRGTLVTVFADTIEKALETDWSQMPPCALRFSGAEE